MTRAKIIDRDRGFKRLVREVRRGLRPPPVKVGILSGSGGDAASGGLSVLDVASIHEFGLGNHPERSFIRAWADADRSKHEDAERALAESVIRGANTTESALGKLGVLLEGEAKKFIQEGRVSPSSDNGGTTLIDTGQLVSSISHEVGD